MTAAAERTADITLRLVRVTRERDHARDIAVALEQQVAFLMEVANAGPIEIPDLTPDELLAQLRALSGELRSATEETP